MYFGEKLNSISHLVGTVFALMAAGALLTVSIQTGDPIVILGFSIFGLSMVFLYTMSTLYHSFQHPGFKRIFKLFDHISIYIFIAGTYTPLMLISIADATGYTILGVVWSLALIGTLSEIFLSGRAVKVVQVLIYLGMGWACALDFSGLKEALPEHGMNWLVAGGLSYSVGLFFYIFDKLRWFKHAHGIWHFFVIGGTLSHFILVIGFVR